MKHSILAVLLLTSTAPALAQGDFLPPVGNRTMRCVIPKKSITQNANTPSMIGFEYACTNRKTKAVEVTDITVDCQSEEILVMEASQQKNLRSTVKPERIEHPGTLEKGTVLYQLSKGACSYLNADRK